MPKPAGSAAPGNPTGKSRDPFVDFERDQWDRPKIPEIGKSGRADLPKAGYTRASTLGGALEDQTNLGLWRAGRAVFGISRSKSLYLAAQSVPNPDGDQHKKALYDLAKKAQDVAETGAAAMIGTAIHALSEQADRGDPLPHIAGEARDALDAWQDLTKGFVKLATEAKTVCDEHRVAGTFDRLFQTLGPMTTPDGERLPAGTVLLGDLKGIALDTPIPTPDGWTTMERVRVGDQVFGSDGRPCAVTAKSEVKHLPNYVVTFDGGERITCDREHLWWVVSGLDYRRNMVEHVVDVETLARSTHNQNGKALHRVPVAMPLDLPDADLPIDPYLLGAWLGDGTHNTSTITKGDDLFAILEADGHQLGTRRVIAHSDQAVHRSVIGLVTQLRAAGLYANKHVPDVYLRASVDQRIALLRGLMDTDGSWDRKVDRATFSTTDKRILEGILELTRSLGLKPRADEYLAHGFGLDVTAYKVHFTPVGFNPFRLPRKAILAEGRTASLNRARHRTIQSIEPGPDVATQCIAVDSPNRTYLCGLDMIPTHNTSSTSKYFGLKFAVQLAEYAHGVPFDIQKYARLSWADLGAPDGPHRKWALIVHVPTGNPAGSGLHWVDIETGRVLSSLAVEILKQRKRNDLVVPASPPTISTALSSAGLHAAILSVDGTVAEAKLRFNELWSAHKGVWSAEHKARADKRLDEIARLVKVGG